LEITMTEPKKTNPLQFVTQNEAVRLTNWFIRTVVVLTARLIAFIVLGIARAISRRRADW
jgi:hypothetical protein